MGLMKDTQQAALPLVSVIMPVYNANGFLALAIDSILKQTYPNIELIIVDDASTDESWQIIKDYTAKHPSVIRAKRLRKNRNRGGEVAGNIAFSMTNPASVFIARMDADDIAIPHRIETQVKYLENRPDVTAVGSIVRIIDEYGNKMGYKKAKATPEQLYRNFFEVSPMIHPTIMFRRSLLPSKSTLYQTELISNNDYLTFSSMVARGYKFANIQKPLLLYRMHTANDSVGNLKRGFYLSIPTRMWMISRHGYRPALSSWIIFLTQLVGITLMPNSMLTFFYLTVRGFISPRRMIYLKWHAFLQRVHLSFPQYSDKLKRVSFFTPNFE